MKMVREWKLRRPRNYQRQLALLVGLFCFQGYGDGEAPGTRTPLNIVPIVDYPPVGMPPHSQPLGSNAGCRTVPGTDCQYPATVEYSERTGYPVACVLANEHFDDNGFFRSTPGAVRSRGRRCFPKLTEPYFGGGPTVVVGGHGSEGYIDGIGSPREAGEIARAQVLKLKELCNTRPADVQVFLYSCCSAENSVDFCRGLNGYNAASGLTEGFCAPDGGKVSLLPYVSSVLGKVYKSTAHRPGSGTPGWKDTLPRGTTSATSAQDGPPASGSPRGSRLKRPGGGGGGGGGRGGRGGGGRGFEPLLRMVNDLAMHKGYYGEYIQESCEMEDARDAEVHAAYQRAFEDPNTSCWYKAWLHFGYAGYRGEFDPM